MGLSWEHFGDRNVRRAGLNQRAELNNSGRFLHMGTSMFPTVGQIAASGRERFALGNSVSKKG